MVDLTYGSVCSGIEAASVAWEPLGWKPAWFSEIEAFPSAVLEHHWPDVENLGDMLAIPDMIELGLTDAPAVLVGGTPCQSFSLAGRRGGLADERGALTLAYVEILNRIDEVRQNNGDEECIAVWENVPGVLSSKDNAFGCFLAGLAGEDEPLQPSGKKWTNAGLVYGPQRAIAWRVLDAQYFGVAQRRRRVFVVASARDGFDPGAVLFESEGLRRDIAPSRETREEVAGVAGCGFKTAGTLDARTNGGGFPGTDGACLGHVVPSKAFRMAAFGEYADDETASTTKARDYKDATDLAVQAVTGDITHTLNTANNGKGCSEDGTGRGVPTIAFKAGQSVAAGGITLTHEFTPTLQSQNNGSTAIPTIAQAVSLRGREGGGTAELGGPVAGTVRASSGGGDKPNVLTGPQGVTLFGADKTVRTADFTDVAGSIRTKPPGSIENSSTTAALHDLKVRRLTPVECERLQGFPDDHTNVPYRGKPAANGPRYKSIGNSMAVPVMAFIGARIQLEVEKQL